MLGRVSLAVENARSGAATTPGTEIARLGPGQGRALARRGETLDAVEGRIPGRTRATGATDAEGTDAACSGRPSLLRNRSQVVGRQ